MNLNNRPNMKINNSLILCLLLQVAYIPDAYTQSKNLKAGTITIRGTVRDYPADSICIELHDYYINHNRAGIKQYTKKLDGPDFSVSLETPGHPFYIIFTTFNRGKQYDYFANYGEPGDDISMVCSKGFHFSGKGAAKYNCRYEAAQLKYKRSLGGMDTSVRLTLPERERIVRRKADSVLTGRLAILERYKPLLTSESYDLLKTDFNYEVLHRDAKNLGDYVYMPGIGADDRLSSFNLFRERYPEQATEVEATTPAKLYSEHYMEFAFWRMINQLRFKDGDHISRNKYTMKDVLSYLDRHFEGLLKEKLMTNSFLWLVRLETTYPYFEPAIANTHEPFFKQALKEKFESAATGVPAFPFQLTDDKGKTVRMVDFKGKVVLIDFWFNGCVGCIALNVETAELMDRLKQDTRFQMVTVSIDPAEKWRSGLSSGRYTHPGAVNLFTMGLGVNHPMIRHYAIDSYPRLILVDKDGKVASVNVPHTTEAIDQLVTTALKK